MCGFVGGVTFHGEIEPFVARLQDGLQAIAHRGPDATDAVANSQVYLGHNRLSIIDLSDAANQPLRAPQADAWIVYNGEIYNFQQLRQSLERVVPFATASDTEVLLQGYLVEGLSFFRKLRGIYAFAILDRRSAPQLILGRDPAGVKPLYHYHRDGLVVFGSEIKALLPAVHQELSINEEVVKAYLNLGYCPEPFTIYREIEALPPGHALIVSARTRRLQAITQYSFDRENSLTFVENTERVAGLLDQAVNRNLVSDVGAGVALSGGIDSSLIYQRAHQEDAGIQGLTVRFNDAKYDETAMAETFARHLQGRHRVLSVEAAGFDLGFLDDLLLHFDQPYCDSSAIPTYHLTKSTRRYTKVLLGGDGGDELFAGYPSLSRLPFVHRLHRVWGGSLLGSLLAAGGRFGSEETGRTLRRAGALLRAEPSQMLFDWLSWFPRNTRFDGGSPFHYSPDEGLACYQRVFQDVQPRSFAAAITFEHFSKLLLSDYLRKTDMMSMLNGVEYRVPLLDEDLVGFALSVPPTQKSSFATTKKILRHLHAQVFPLQTSHAPKHGFSIPLDNYLSPEVLFRMRELVLNGGEFVKAYVREDYLKFVFDVAAGTRPGRREMSREGTYQRILLFYSLELWHQRSQGRAESVSVGALGKRPSRIPKLPRPLDCREVSAWN